MLQVILEWNLDVAGFALFVISFMIFIDQRYIKLHFDERRRGALRAAGLIMVFASMYLAVGRGETEREQLQKAIQGFAPTYADEFREHGHEMINPDTNPEDPLYRELIEKEKTWLSLSRVVHDIYTMRRDRDGTVRLIVDSETDYDRNGRFEGDRESRTEIGEEYTEITPTMEIALRGFESFDGHPHTDRWGTWVSAYSPILNSAGQIDGIVGVDFDGSEWISSMLWARASVLGFATALILTVLGSSGSVALLEAELRQKAELSGELQRKSESLEQMNEQLVKARDAAENANRAKSEFLANMSHEIRTPMNGILGLTELLLQSSVSPDQKRSLELVVSSGEALMTVLNDILDFSKIEANMLQIDPTPFEPREVVGNAMKLLGLRAEQKRIELTCRILPSVPNVVVGDAGRIRQVLVNLVGNAIKFTHHGEVAVTVADIRDGSRPAELLFSVRDTGIGISGERQASIFEPFIQADGSTTRHYGGTGLGLAICTRLVEPMDGRIWVESEPGVGSIFYFQIPFSAAPTSEHDQVNDDAGTIPRQHVLVVDDHPTNRLILEEVLTAWRMDAKAIGHGQLVRETLLEARLSGNPYSLILLDVHMPDMDGFDVAEMIRQIPEASDVPVILLSSSDAVHHSRSLRGARISGYLTKPIKQSELLEAILKISSTDAASTSSTTNSGSATSERTKPAEPVAGSASGENGDQPVNRGRLLVVEDNYVNQQLMQRVLTRRGYDVVIAADGNEAVMQLAADDFDVVLMDCQMPVMDGYEATRVIRRANRQSRSGQRLPIIALTANAMSGDRQRCLDAGMDDFVTKPISFALLSQTLEKYLVLPRAQVLPSPGDVEPVDPGTPLHTDSATVVDHGQKQPAVNDSLMVLNREELLGRTGGDADLIEILAGAFREDSPKHINALCVALADDNAADAKRIAHTIKGCAGNLSGIRLFEFAKTLEQMTIRGDLTSARMCIPQLEVEISNLIQEIEEFSASLHVDRCTRS
ncbi:MAG: response regulator [Planctomyces sp.]|nr:response regulator [Planctomyces sp.]